MEEVDALLAALAGLACDGTLEGLELCIFAPYVFLERARRLLPPLGIKDEAQARA